MLTRMKLDLRFRAVQVARKRNVWRPPDDFAVVSNNCWGAHICRHAGLPYNSPFVNLFIFPSCYLKLLENFDSVIEQSVRVCRSSRHIADPEYPVGLLGDDIEIHFLHYGSMEEALSKWDRRVARLRSKPRRLFAKFDDRDGCSSEHIKRFQELRGFSKVFFSSRPASASCGIRIPGGDHVPDGLTLSSISPIYFDARRWIEGANPRVGRLWSPFRPV